MQCMHSAWHAAAAAGCLLRACFVRRAHVLESCLSLFLADGVTPSHCQLLFAGADTSIEEIDAFLHRAVYADVCPVHVSVERWWRTQWMTSAYTGTEVGAPGPRPGPRTQGPASSNRPSRCRRQALVPGTGAFLCILVRWSNSPR